MTARKRYNVFSNLAYLGLGVVGPISGGQLGWMYLIAMKCLTAGSMAYHYLADRRRRLTRYGRWADEIGMYCVLSTLVFLA